MDVKLRPTGMLRQLYLILHKLQPRPFLLRLLHPYPLPPARPNSSNRAEYVRRASAISAPAACTGTYARAHARARAKHRRNTEARTTEGGGRGEAGGGEGASGWDMRPVLVNSFESSD